MSRVAPIAVDQLAAAIGLGDRELVSLVGGGGKTTALFALGRQLPKPVVLTTTTKMGRSRTGGHEPLFDPDDASLATALADRGSALVWRAEAAERAEGVDPERCDRWFNTGWNVVVEADGSRRMPFKAPADYEPVVPEATTTLVACVGTPAFDTPIGECCLRPEVVARLADCDLDDRLTPERLARVLVDPQGSAKGRPDGARFVVVINQVTDDHRPFVDELRTLLPADQPLVAVARFAPGAGPG